jgi:NAD(P) transhydrogenase
VTNDVGIDIDQDRTPPAHASFDLVVVGSGPAGQKAALCAAKLGRRVAIIDRRGRVGGVCIHTGTIPSKAIREAVLHLTDLHHGAFGKLADHAAGTARVTMADLLQRAQHVSRCEARVIDAQMRRNGVTLLDGDARFLDEHTLAVDNGRELHHVRGERILIAVGTEPARPASVPFTPGRVIDSNEILKLDRLPRDMCIVGGGVIGTEYAAMLGGCGVRVTLIEGRSKLMEFLDDEIVETLQYRLRRAGVRLRLGEKVESIEVSDTPGRRRDDDDSVAIPGGAVTATLASGKVVTGDTLLYCIGRQGATESLHLNAANLTADKRGRLEVDEFFQTARPHIYAAGDVVGFPALASTSMEQGRRAALHMFRPEDLQRPARAPSAAVDQLPAPSRGIGTLFPFGIYTIPEISMVGRTERELTDAGVPYEAGVARYDEIARGQLMGDVHGLLKLLFCPDSHRLLGVHAIGSGATEIIHIGQVAMTSGMPLEYFVDAVFNYPTLAECYKVAALDGLNRCRPAVKMWRAAEKPSMPAVAEAA